MKYNPLFNERDTLKKLMDLYKVKPLVDLFNTNTIIKDDNLSYLIISENLYVLIILDKIKDKFRFILRDNFNVYVDSYTKDNWKIKFNFNDFNVIDYSKDSNNIINFINIDNGFIKFNKSFINLNVFDKIKRIIALTNL